MAAEDTPLDHQASKQGYAVRERALEAPLVTGAFSDEGPDEATGKLAKASFKPDASGTASGRALAGGHHAVDTWI